MQIRFFLRSFRDLVTIAGAAGSLLASPCGLLAQTRNGDRSEAAIPRAIPVAPRSDPEVAATRSRTPGLPAVEAAPEPPRADPATIVALPSTMQGLNDKRQLGIGDRLSMNIVEDEMPARPVVITDSGEIDAPWIGRVTVGNRTCKQLAFYLKGLFEKELYHQATVLVGLDSAGARTVSRGRFYISGQVMRPGQMELPADEKITVSKAIMRAGGFGQYADKKKVKLMRGGSDRPKKDTIVCNMVDVMEKGINSNDPELLPEDLVIVEEKWLNF